MDCRQFLDELSDYLDNEATAGIREAVQEHIAFCHKCEVIYNSTRRTVEIVSECGQQAYALPEDVSERLYTRLRARLKSGDKPAGG